MHGSLDVTSDVKEAVQHFNLASDRSEAVESSRLLSDALNKIQTDWLRSASGSSWTESQRQRQSPNQGHSERPGEVKTFQAMMLHKLCDSGVAELFDSNELRNFVELDPPIMSHKVLIDHGYQPGKSIEPALLRKATRVHVALRRKFKKRGGTSEDRKELLKIAAELLYIVRSNINHGEKSVGGPDLEKAERDRSVAAVAQPLQRLLFDLLLDRPSRRLVAYGTLVPDGANRSVVSGIPGEWKDCTIEGNISISNGLPFFSSGQGSSVHAKLFISDELPRNWKRLDDFEGSRYKRRIVFAIADGNAAAAFAYVKS